MELEKVSNKLKKLPYGYYRDGKIGCTDFNGFSARDVLSDVNAEKNKYFSLYMYQNISAKCLKTN